MLARYPHRPANTVTNFIIPAVHRQGSCAVLVGELIPGDTSIRLEPVNDLVRAAV